MISVRVSYFASVREAMGCSAETLETEATTVAALRDALIARGGTGADALVRTQAVRTALNHVMVSETALLTPGCEVAFFPPVTGG
jgi:molybdopterin synthase sulfur carrier subunit